jgi:pyruvate dehydrogenase (quinone)
LQAIDFAAFARACGASGFTIERAFECGAILQEALATPGPVIVEAIVDPNEPPMPAKITLDQAKKFTESLIRGTPHRGQIALTVLSDKIKELI